MEHSVNSSRWYGSRRVEAITALSSSLTHHHEIRHPSDDEDRDGKGDDDNDDDDNDVSDFDILTTRVKGSKWMMMTMGATGVSIAVREAARKGRKITKVHQDEPGWTMMGQVGPGWARIPRQ
jgi:hypothetical protein